MIVCVYIYIHYISKYKYISIYILYTFIHVYKAYKGENSWTLPGKYAQTSANNRDDPGGSHEWLDDDLATAVENDRNETT